MRNRVGSPVEGEDFFGREVELITAWELLEAENHLLISAPRRVGKTSLVRHLVKDAEVRGWKALFVNVEGEDSEIGFVRQLVEGLKEQKNWIGKAKDSTVKAVTNLLQSLEVEVKADDIGSVKVNWSQTKATDLKVQLAELLRQMGDGLIVIDELPVMLNRMANAENGKSRTESFLHWLRAFRQLPGIQVRWVFCGSIGLDSFTERLGVVKTINDLYDFPLGAFSSTTADLFLDELGKAEQIQLSPDVRQEIIRQVGWPLPYYLQLIFSKLKIIARSKGSQQAATIADVSSAFTQAANYSKLSTWLERLDEQLSLDDARLAKGLLDMLCRQEKGRKRAHIEQYLIGSLHIPIDLAKDSAAKLLKMLERDGYLVTEAGIYAFRSPLLRMFWFNSRIQ
ncbi:AAA family ATPase [Fibrella aquatica]|uniref:AAA family ATPase n=1 Tax=Fibrella aquatica TaxID=3242487 RepID=UPI00351FCD56